MTIPETNPPILSSSPQNTASPNKAPNQKVALQPNSKQSNIGFSSSSRNEIPTIAPEIQTPPSSLSDPGITSPSSISALPPALPNLSSAPSINPNPAISSPNSTTRSESEELIGRLRQGRRNNNLPTQVATSSSSERLLDTAQIAEARDFLKERWEPPTGLKQAIEYSLLVGVDGSIERIMPLGKAARDYVDRTGMPLIGEPFVSPNKSGQSVRIRAVFSPDGKVQTFPETE
ncbi:hypothetical protein NUACC21_14470 [Scytonema sp. NUACC21]